MATSRSDAVELPDERPRKADIRRFSGIRDEARRRALHGGLSRPKAGLKSLTDREVSQLEGTEVLAVKMSVTVDHAGAAARVLEVRHAAEGCPNWVQIGKHHSPTWANHSAQLGDGGEQVCDMLESQRGYDQIDAGGIERQRGQIAMMEHSIGHLRPRHMPTSVTTRLTRRVQGRPGRDLIHE